MERSRRLGKGLSALIPTEPIDGEGVDGNSALRELPISSIIPNRYQPRQHFDEDDLDSLTASIRELGVLQPILVRPVTSGDGDGHGTSAAGRQDSSAAGPTVAPANGQQNGDSADTTEPGTPGTPGATSADTVAATYELIAGERRWRAAKRAGLQTIPALVRSVTDTSSLEQALVENLHRADLNAMEEAAAYQQLVDDFDMTHDKVAKRVGKSRSAVTNTLRLFQLPPSIQKLVSENQLSAGHARALLASPDRAFIEGLARRVVAEALSVREVEEAVKTHGDEDADVSSSDEQMGEGGAGSSDADDPSRRRLRPAGLLELEELLSDYLETRVSVSMGQSRGKVQIDFADLEDLERIYRLIASQQ